MRILFMTDTPENADSGAAGTEYQTAAALRRLGHDVDAVWADQLPRRLQHGNLHYLLELPLTYQNCMLARMHDKRYDVVHASQPHGYLAARASRHSTTRPVFVHRSHGLEARAAAALAPWRFLEERRSVPRRLANTAMAALLEFNNRAIARHADGHLVSAELCASYLHQHYGVSRERIAVVPQAPPPEYLDLPAGALTPARLTRLLHVGQLAFFKAPMILANAFEQILAGHPHATLTWVCAASDHRSAAALLAPQTRERVRFLDWVPQRRLRDVYDEHGVFLFPSFFEGFGKAFLEAMARGLVVIASAEGGARDLVDNGRNGFLVPVGDAEAMARACLSVQTGSVDAQAVSWQARRSASVHTWDRVADETAAFYRRLIALQ
jgi:glycosyltransferase involved in cell wall biosynthesis